MYLKREQENHRHQELNLNAASILWPYSMFKSLLVITRSNPNVTRLIIKLFRNLNYENLSFPDAYRYRNCPRFKYFARHISFYDTPYNAFIRLTRKLYRFA